MAGNSTNPVSPSSPQGFTGVMTLRVLEAMGLEEANVRSQVVTTFSVSSIDPYLQVNIDDENVAKTTKKFNTFSPVWEEDFSIGNLNNAKTLSFTVFHSSKVGEDSFVANSSVPLQAIIEEGQPDLWVGWFISEIREHQQKTNFCLA